VLGLESSIFHPFNRLLTSSHVAQIVKSSITQNYYSVSVAAVTFDEAVMESEEETYAGVQGHLFVPNSFLELGQVQGNIIAPLFGGNHWLGMTDEFVEGKWVVAAGPNEGTDVSDIMPWWRGEPDGGTSQNCVIHAPGYYWAADVVCSHTYRYVIEFECPFGKRFNNQGTACIGMLFLVLFREMLRVTSFPQQIMPLYAKATLLVVGGCKFVTSRLPRPSGTKLRMVCEGSMCMVTQVSRSTQSISTTC
jgi:hypothetical protein